MPKVIELGEAFKEITLEGIAAIESGSPSLVMMS
jgi:hypothetical protein